MRVKIHKDEWDKYYYCGKQKFRQKRIIAAYKTQEIEKLNWFAKRRTTLETLEEETDKVRTCLGALESTGFLSTTGYDLPKFLEFRADVHKNFVIIWTAISSVMEHLLYAISAALQPERILGLGIFTGNPLIWSLGPAIKEEYLVKHMAGVEIDPNHAKICQENMNKVSPERPVLIHAADGFDILETYADESLDLLYLDANGFDPVTQKSSKNINTTFLKRGYSKLKPGGAVICHNAYMPSFKRDASGYLEFTRNREFFQRTVTVAVDEMGIEFSIKK